MDGAVGAPGPEKENVSQAVVLETPLTLQTLQTCRAHKLIVMKYCCQLQLRVIVLADCELWSR